MGRTSLLMFPIYGCGALLGPIGKWIDDWLNPGKSLSVKKSDLAVRHGIDVYKRQGDGAASAEH